MNILAIINQKGGVGKSTTAHAIGAGIALKGFKVLYIDLDAQGNLSYTTGALNSDITALEVLQRKADITQAIQHTPQGDIVASSPLLAGADLMITATGKEYRLKEALKPISGLYDYCIIDTPPALGILAINALTACSGAIIPTQADIYSLQGIGQLYNTIQTVKEYCNADLHIKGIVLTRYNNRSIISREVAEKLKITALQMNTKLYKTRIRECTALKEAQAKKTDIFRYAPRSNAAADYIELVNEVLKGV